MYVNGRTLVRTRFAQEPEDRLNINSVRVAIFNYLFARRYGGTFILRVDDTTKSNEFTIKRCFDDMTWLGLNWDEGPVYQSNRLAHYRDVAGSLIRAGNAYPDDGDNIGKTVYRGVKRNLPPSMAFALWDDTGWPLRFKVDSEDQIVLDDIVKGQIRWDASNISDPIIILADGSATADFATVVDDAEMKISHVIRCEDELNDTPAQILLANALGYVPPFFAHVPCVLSPSVDRPIRKQDLDNFVTSEVRAKLKGIGFSAQEILSREELNPITVSYYQTLGYKPEALVNYLANLGLSHQEVTTKYQMGKEFTLKRSLTGRFDPDQLLHLAGEHTKEDSLNTKVSCCEEFLKMAKVSFEHQLVREAVALCGDRIKVYSDILTRGFFFFSQPVYDQYDVDKYLTKDMRNLIYVFIIRLKHVKWNADAIENTTQDFMRNRDLKFNNLTCALSVAITGRANGPCIFHVMETLGKEKCLARIEETLDLGEVRLEDYI